MASISSPGIGSNLDVNSIVSKLMSVEAQPLSDLNRTEVSYQTQLSSLGNLKGALSSFQSAAKDLSLATKFQGMRAGVSDGTVLSATATSSAAVGTHTVEVTSLASSQRLATVGQASSTASLGTGVLTFDFGKITGTIDNVSTNPDYLKYQAGASFNVVGTQKTVTIGAGQDTLEGVRDAINSAKIGVTASIVNDGGTNPYRLVLAVDGVGENNSLRISADTAGLQGLMAQDVTAGPAGQKLQEYATAQNAKFKVDGLSVSKTSNTVTDVIAGVTLNLIKTTTTTPATVNVSRDSGSITSAMNTLVKSYNDLQKTLNDVGGYNAATKQAGPLQGQSSVRSVRYDIRSALSQAFAGTGSLSSLSDIGLSIQRDGTMKLDSSKLQSAIDNNLTDLTSLFTEKGTTGVPSSQGFGVRLAAAADGLLAEKGALGSQKSGLEARIKDIGKRRDALTDRLGDIEARYRKQFTALDTMMGQMTTTSNYLARQFANM